ncbi:MAG: histidine phosphatase family protein [Mariprofundaceae bacterium]
MSEVVTIDLMRHGAVEGRQHVARGSTDDPVSELGWKQMLKVKSTIGSVDEIATSPLKRCRLFAGSCTENMVVLEAMQELDFGDWENKSADEVDDKVLLQRFFDDPAGFQAPAGELFEVFSERVIQAWELWLTTGEAKHRLLIAHGCVLRVILAYLLDIPTSKIWSLSLPLASWSRVSILDGEKPCVLFMNRLSELK